MQIIPMSYEIMQYPTNVLENIEKAARTCYKSEGKIGPGSAEKIVAMLIKRRHHAMLEFGGWIHVKFTTNRGVTHEQVRHRLTSLAQESTRYCDYSSDDKFDQGVVYCDPTPMLEMKGYTTEQVNKAFEIKCRLWRLAEEAYQEQRTLGISPECARDVLCIGTKSEINMGTNVREWRHILSQRTSPAAHPQMRQIMVPLLEDFRMRTPIIWDDLSNG